MRLPLMSAADLVHIVAPTGAVDKDLFIKILAFQADVQVCRIALLIQLYRQLIPWKMSGMHIREEGGSMLLSDSYLTLFRLLSDSDLTLIWFLSDSYLTLIWLLPDSWLRHWLKAGNRASKPQHYHGVVGKQLRMQCNLASAASHDPFHFIG